MHREKYYSSQLTGTNVEVRNGDVNGALRRLRKILDRDNQQKDLARLEYYEKPGIQRKKSKAIAAKRWKKQTDLLKAQRIIPDGLSSDTKYLKSKRKRRRRLDQEAAMISIRRKAKSVETA